MPRMIGVKGRATLRAAAVRYASVLVVFQGFERLVEVLEGVLGGGSDLLVDGARAKRVLQDLLEEEPLVGLALEQRGHLPHAGGEGLGRRRGRAGGGGAGRVRMERGRGGGGRAAAARGAPPKGGGAGRG